MALRGMSESLTGANVEHLLLDCGNIANITPTNACNQYYHYSNRSSSILALDFLLSSQFPPLYVLLLPSVVVDAVLLLVVAGGTYYSFLESGLCSNRTRRLISDDCFIRVFVAIYVPEQYVTYASYGCV